MKIIIQMILLIILISACSMKKEQGQYDELFSNKGKWVPVNSQNIEQEDKE